jgi:hypothetical protein
MPEPAEEKVSTLTSEEKKPEEAEKELLSWSAANRPFKRRNKSFWVRIIAMAGVFGLILFLAEGVMPVLLIISVVFLFYVLSTVEPENTDYKITNKGIRIGGVETRWEVLGRFWMSRRFDSEIMVVEAPGLAGRIELIIKPEIKDELKEIVGKHLVYQEVPASELDRAANWFAARTTRSK